MTNDIRKIIEIIHQNQSFAIIPHVNPDSDAIGTCVAMKYALNEIGKKAEVYIQKKLSDRLAYLPDECTVYSGQTDADVCMCIDCGDIMRVDGRMPAFESAKVKVNIDHHHTNTYFADYNLVQAHASSSSEICYPIIKEISGIDERKAFCLYSAICADTGGFKYSNTSPTTMRIAADLMEKNIPNEKINKALFDTEKLNLIRLKGEISKNVAIYHNGLTAVAQTDEKMCSGYGISIDNVDNIVDISRKVEGVEVAIAFKIYDGEMKVSLRSNEYVDVSEISLKFGGGGHVRAAGFNVKDTSDEMKKRIIDEVEKALKDCGK